MSAINEIFGSGSENESENNEVEQEKEHHQEEREEEDEEEEENEQEEHEENELEEEEQHENDKSQEEQEQENQEENEQEHEEENEHNQSGEVEEEQEENENGDDDDDDIVRKAPKAAAEVFGDELADLSESDNEEDNNNNPSNSQTNLQNEEEEQEPETVIDMEIPRVKTDLGKEVHFVKLPNFLSVESRPFDTETYEDENLNVEAQDEEGKSRVRLKVENTIRWRYEKDNQGNIIKQSNARMVKWSDGSLSMYLGNEIFDVYKAYMQGDHNHLFIRQGNVLQGQCVFKTKLTFRPHSIDSMTHRKMTLSLVESNSKTKKVKILNEIAKNPENKRLELMKQEEEKLKAASRRQNQQRRMREKSHQKDLSAKYLEDKNNSDDDNGISLSDIKSNFKRGNKYDTKIPIYSSSSDESDREKRLNKAKLNDSDNDYDDSNNESDYDDSLSKKSGARSSSSSSKKKKMRKVVSDDDDE